jgi:hypothetical protein
MLLGAKKLYEGIVEFEIAGERDKIMLSETTGAWDPLYV